MDQNSNITKDNNNNSSNKALALVDHETKERVARACGKEPHNQRGLQAADEETQIE